MFGVLLFATLRSFLETSIPFEGKEKGLVFRRLIPFTKCSKQQQQQQHQEPLPAAASASEPP